MYLALMDSGSAYLGAYLRWGRGIEAYSENAIHRTVVTDISRPLPSEHFVVEYLGKLIAFGASGQSSFNDGVQITYWVRQTFAGLGIGTWLVSEMIDYLFYVRDRSIIEIHTDLTNVASARIPRNLGFFEFDTYTQTKDFGFNSSKVMTIWVKVNPRLTISSRLQHFRVGRMYKDSYFSDSID